MTAVPWSDIETRGFVVIPGVLTPDEIQMLVDEFTGNARAGETMNPNYGGLRFIRQETRAKLAPKLVGLAKQASGDTMDRLRFGIYYSTSLGVEFDWHTDSTSYYIYPQYLNLWIPLIKPDRTRSGLSILDNAKLAARYPALAAGFRGRGAVHVEQEPDRLVFVDHDRVERIAVPDAGLLAELAETPPLDAGDVLMLRSDVFHRTQDTSTERLAISFRAVSWKTTITRAMLSTMGAAKFNNMARMRSYFAKRFATFDIAETETLTVGQYDRIFAWLEKRELKKCRELGVDGLNSNEFDDLVLDLTLERRARVAARGTR